ncbi:hypothetical protein AMS68_007058 [Peltaster fructicola]|uniref:Geranylgeranyl pyrophosphate synthetase n=1 Tax=Peltaster fructicola TaxID=286661 RepID=A0A6H0Y3P8_9PEZI|nr:hypothetical protein AMS68_007058 [Peltaster fructicola]
MQQRPYRGSGRGGASSRGRTRFTPAERQPRAIPPNLGPETRRITLDDLETTISDGAADITDCEYVSSYNLMDDMSKKILVPGRPPLWTPLPHARRIRADAGTYYRDDNSARFPDYPYEPVVLSVFQMIPNFDPLSIDVAACGSTLGSLLRFVRGIGEPFSCTVQIIGQTLFIIRRELSPQALIENVYGFGHAFLEANTTWSQDVKGSASHQRVIKYQLGAMTVLMRFEADTYTMDQSDALEDEEDGVLVNPASVEDALADLLVTRRPAAVTDHAEVTLKGARTSLASLADVKTRSAKKRLESIMSDEIPRLWVRQVQNIVLSFHDKGLFEPPTVQDITSAILEWEEDNETAICRLVNLIGQIKEAAIAARGGKIEVRCEDAHSLQFHELSAPQADKWNALPDDLYERWAPEQEDLAV